MTRPDCGKIGKLDTKSTNFTRSIGRSRRVGSCRQLKGAAP